MIFTTLHFKSYTPGWPYFACRAFVITLELMRRAILLLLLFSFVGARSQTNSFIFHHVTEKDGLSNNTVNCFLKDSRGIFWIGTYDGLNRYDGAHFYIFKRTKSSSSIGSNVVHSLCEDKQRNIWGATENGIFCYNPETNTFKNYSTPNNRYAPVAGNIARAVQNILCDQNGDIWATGVWTFLKLNKEKDRFDEALSLSHSTDSLNHYSIRRNGMIEDPSGKGLWLATRIGIHYYEFKSGGVLSFKNRSDSLFMKRGSCAMFKSKSGNFWFYDNSSECIRGFDPATKKLTRRIEMRDYANGSAGATLFEDSENRLWFSTWVGGLTVIDPIKNIVTPIKNDINNPSTVAGDFFWAATQDDDGSIWLGTVNGISKCNTSKSIYRVHRFLGQLPILKNNSIRLIVEDTTDNSWWLVTQKRLYVIHYFPSTNKHEIYDLENAVKSVDGYMPGPVYKIRFDGRDPVLMTHSGAWKIDLAKNRIVPFIISPIVDPSFVIREWIELNGVTYFSDRFKLMKYDSRSQKVSEIKFPTSKLSNGLTPQVLLFLPMPDNRLWFFAGAGWIAYVNEKDEIVPINLVKNVDEEYFGYFNHASPDKEGNIWIASTGVGLYRYKPAIQHTKFWNETDGLNFDFVQMVIPDNNGRIWTVVGNKISIFTPETESFFNFSIPLSENSFGYENGMALLSNGSMAITMQNEVIEFFPHRLSFTPTQLKPIIGAVNIAGKDLFIDEKDKITMNPDENTLTIKFGLFTDQETFPYSFEYKLEGLDDKWILAGSSNQAVYNKLPSGNYTFRLVAKGRGGQWTTPEKILKIHVKRPFIKSIWFYALTLSLTALLLFSFYRFRTAKQRQLHELTGKAQMLEKEKALVMYENLKQHLNPHFLFNSLTSLGSLIRIDQVMAGDFLDKMSKVYRYILKNRDNEVVPLSEELKFVQLYIDLQKTRFEKALQVTVTVDEEHYHRKIAPVTLQNLVENAIKHNTSEPGSPLHIELFVENDYLVVRNNLQRKSFVETSNKQGLSNMESLYRYMSNRPMEILEDERFFTVKIPLL